MDLSQIALGAHDQPFYPQERPPLPRASLSLSALPVRRLVTQAAAQVLARLPLQVACRELGDT